MEKITLTRKGFYDLIWSEPLSRLSKKYAISDNGLRKMCKKYNVPIMAAREKAMAEGGITEKRQEWILWATKKADWYDPLCETTDDLLDS